MLGVGIFVCPKQPTSPHPKSSAKINTTFGLAGDTPCADEYVAESGDAKTNANNMKSDFRFEISDFRLEQPTGAHLVSGVTTCERILANLERRQKNEIVITFMVSYNSSQS